MRYSVITINYNNKDGLSKTIQSVINQKYNDYEYIIIDGGSTDGSIDIIKEHVYGITYWISEKDNGIYNAMNKGILVAKGDYCIFMNSGDCFHSPNVLEMISQYSEDVINGKVSRDDYPYPNGFFKDTITMIDLYRRSLEHQSSFIRRTLFENCPYDENLKIVADWKFFIQQIILNNCSFRNTDIIVADYDISGISSNNLNLDKSERQKVLKELLPNRILLDYERFAYTDDCFIDIAQKVYPKRGAKKMIYLFSKFVLWLSNTIKI